MDYSTQTPVLEERYGDAAFVASPIVMKSQPGGPRSVVTWSDGGGTTLLPVASHIALVTEKDIEARAAPILAKWQHVAEILGPMLQPTDYFPTRWRVDGFPSAEQLSTIAAAQ